MPPASRTRVSRPPTGAGGSPPAATGPQPSDGTPPLDGARPPDGTPRPVGREVAREQMLERIRVAAHVHLAREGAAGLSMRAVARDVGVVSSAIYRYVPSRDALLRLLVTDASADLATAAAEAESGVRRGDLRARFVATARAVRAWALAHPAEHALIASRPVPGFEPPAVPPGTVGVVAGLFVSILDEAAARAAPPDAGVRLPAGVRRDLAAVRRTAGVQSGEDVVARALLAWAAVAGAVGLELSGQVGGLTADPEPWFAHEVDRLARSCGLS